MEDSSMDMENMGSLRPHTFLFGCELKDDKEYHFKVNDDENEHQLSLRTVSLGAGANDELHVVEAEALGYEGNQITITLASLKMSVQPTVSLGGFEITPPVTLKLKCGSGPVHVSGQHLVALEEEPESEEEEEEIKAPKNIKKRASSMSLSKVPQKRAKLSEDDDDDDEEEDDEDDDDIEDDEEDDEDEEEEKTPSKGAKNASKSNQNGKDSKLIAAKLKALDPPKGKRPTPAKSPLKVFSEAEIKAKMQASVNKGATLPKTENKFGNYIKNCFRMEDQKVIHSLWKWRQSL